MTLIKSMLLGSAAAIVAVAAAQAADLPTRKAAPVQFVQICNVGGIIGWVLPGSDTCVKLSGYITGQFVGGNLNAQYNFADSFTAHTVEGAPDSFKNVYGGVGGLASETIINSPSPATAAVGGFIASFPTRPFSVSDGRGGFPVNSDALGQPNQMVLFRNGNTFNRSETGWTTRANFGFDFASNTAYGPLIGHFDINSENGNGLDNVNATYLNTGYVTWAGITAGKAASFYSFTGGGDNWANFFSPDQKGFNEPNLLAYTASFGGGFSATIAAQSPGANLNLGSGGGTQYGARIIPISERTTAASPRGHHLRRPALARHRRRPACQAGLGRGPGLGRDPRRQRSGR